MNEQNEQNKTIIWSDEPTLLDYLQVIVRWRKMIVSLVISAIIIAVIISLLLPKQYIGRATVLPQENKASSLGLSGLLMNSNMPIGNLSGLSNFQNPSVLYLEILKSRTIAQRILDRHDLLSVYELNSVEKTIETLHDHSTFTTDVSGFLVIEVEAPSPQLAADMANSYVDELDRFNREDNITSAKNTRVFVEQRVNETQVDLKNALLALQQFQQEYQLVSLTEQAKMLVVAAAETQSQIRVLEFEYALIRKTLYASHPEVAQVKAQIDELRKQIDQLKFGNQEGVLQPDVTNGSMIEFTMPFSKVPEIQRRLSELMMNVKVHQSVLEVLLQQFEHAKISEIHDTPTLHRLDKAIPPETRSKPKRTLIVVLTGLVAICLSIVLAFVFDYGRKAKIDQQESSKLDQIKSMLRTDFRGMKQGFSKRKDGLNS